MNGMVSVPLDEVNSQRLLALPNYGAMAGASPKRLALSLHSVQALAAASWPIRLTCGLVVVLLHLLVAVVGLSASTHPVTPPKQPVVAVRWVAAPEPADRQVPPVSQPQKRTLPPTATPVARPAVKPKPKPKPLVKSPSRVVAPAEAHPQRQERRSPAMAPAKAVASTEPQAVPIREPQYQSATLRNPAPSYPPLSRRFGEQGSVMLRVLVSATGEPLQVELLSSSGHARLDAAARKMVAKWRFIPAQQGQEKIQAWVRVPVVFQLRRKT